MSVLKKLFSQVALYGISSIIGRLVTFVFLTPYLTRAFAPQELGIQTDLYAYAGFLLILFSFRVETAFFNFGKNFENRPHSFLAAAAILYSATFLLTALLLIFALPIAIWLEYPEKSAFVGYFGLILAFDALAALPLARLRLENKAKKFALIKILNLVVQIFALLFLLEIAPRYEFSFYRVENRVDYVFLANVIASASSVLLLLPQFSLRFWTKNESLKAIFDWNLCKKIIFYSFPLVLAGLAGAVNEVFDRILLKNLLTGSVEERLYAVGIYGGCYKIAIFMNLFTQAFNYAAEPFFFREANRQDARQIYADLSYLFNLAACAGFVSVMLFMDLGQYFVAAPYRVGLDIVLILLLANLFLGLYYNLAAWFKLADKTQFAAYIGFAGAAITLIFNLLLIPKMGYLGAAWATLSCYFAMVALCYLLGQRYFPIPYQTGRIVAHIVAAVLFWQLFLSVKSYTNFNFLITQGFNFIFLAVYLIIILFLEKNRVIKMLKRV